MRNFLLILLIITLTQASLAQTPSNQTDSSKTLFSQTKNKLAFVNSEQFRLSGYGQGGYYASDEQGVNSALRINRIILFATGSLLNPKFTYMLMYDFGPKSALHEFYGEYTPVVASSFRFGQFKVPFTLENPMSPTRWEGIFPSLSVNALAGGATDVIGPKAGRDMGAMVSGRLFKQQDFYQIEYAGGLFNGTGFNTPENNNHKDFAGTLIYQPIKGLKLAGTGYSGQAFYQTTGQLSPSNHVRNRWSVGGEYNQQKCYIRSEYLYGNDAGIDRNGYYLTAMWKILPDKLEIFGKYDFYDSDQSLSSNEIREYTGGISYYIGFLSRIQLNYIRTNASTKQVNTLATQLQLFF